MAIYPNVLAGQDISADLLNAMLPKVAYKPNTTSRASNTTAADDPDLIIGLGANDLGTYLMEGFITYTGGAITVGGLKMAFNYTGTATAGTWGTVGHTTASLTENHVVGGALTGGTQSFGTNGGSFDTLLISGSITATTAGTLSFQWAQASSSATATNIRLGSWLKLTRIA